ncbi:MAG: low molecular weight phosphatase family protein [Gaiellaceae bacterium]
MNVLFVCTANGGRSVISERLLEREAEGRHHARSAGSMPGQAAHPEVIEALRELGVDARDHVPRKLSQELIDWADVVVATCDDACPYVPGKGYVNWQLPDPKGQPVERVREIRDDIAGRIAMLIRELDASTSH